MGIRILLIGLTTLFLLVGVILLNLSNRDPAPRDSWQTFGGELQEVVFTDTKKVGRRATVTITNEYEPSFALNDTRRFPEFEAKVSGIAPGTAIEIEAVPRAQAGWAAPEGEPLALLVLRNGEDVIYDRDRDQTGGEWIETAVRIAAWLAIAFSALLAALSFKVGGKG